MLYGSSFPLASLCIVLLCASASTTTITASTQLSGQVSVPPEIGDNAWVVNVPYGTVNLMLSYDASGGNHLYAMLLSEGQEAADFVGLQFQDLPYTRTVQLASATGHAKIRAAVVSSSASTPVSFSWTTVCWSGSSSSDGMSCIPPAYSCGPGSYYDTARAACMQCPAGTFSATGRQSFCAPCPKDMFASQPGSASCSRVSNNVTGQFAWQGSGLQINADVSWVVQVNNANVTLMLSHLLEAGYDFVYITTVSSGGTPASSRTGTSSGVQFASSTGYVQIRVITDFETTYDNPISFSWTSQCKAGYVLVGGICRTPPVETWVVCEAGQIVNSTVLGCSPCPGGTYSETGWVTQLFV
jgi:hypothetical protein